MTYSHKLGQTDLLSYLGHTDLLSRTILTGDSGAEGMSWKRQEREGCSSQRSETSEHLPRLKQER